MWHPYGHVVHIPGDVEEVCETIKNDMSEGFIKALKLAEKQQVNYIRFDRDGVQYDTDELNNYDW